MIRPTPMQDVTVLAILLTAALWSVFGYGVWRMVRGAWDLNDLGGTR